MRCVVFLASAAVVLASRIAHADPQFNAGLTIGAAGVGYEHAIWKETDFHLGMRTDLTFLRNKNSDFGLGPYLELQSLAFRDVQFGGGASLVVPVLDSLPIVVSAGGYARKGVEGYGLEPGVAGELFWGSRSYNFNANYVLVAGVFGQVRYGLGETKQTAIVIGARVDFAMIALPFLFLINAARGGSHDTDRVR